MFSVGLQAQGTERIKVRKRVGRPVAVLSTSRPSTRIEVPEGGLGGDVGCIARKETGILLIE